MYPSNLSGDVARSRSDELARESARPERLHAEELRHTRRQRRPRRWPR